MINKTTQGILLLSLILIFFSCGKDENNNVDGLRIIKYLHLSHTRTNSNPGMDPVAEGIDYSKYDMLWLGGDLAAATSWDDSTMSHVDSIYNLGSSNTLWSLGNHDYDDLPRITMYTHRPAYYAAYKNGITFIVLDTQDSLSNIVGDQQIFFNDVVDTIQESSHLVVLMHKLIWMFGNTELESEISAITNGGFGSCFYCINPNNFYEDIYPKLLTVKQRGIAVICVSGDIGFNVKEYSYKSPEGIDFLASGINFSGSNNRALLFYHDISTKRLTWSYVPLAAL